MNKTKVFVGLIILSIILGVIKLKRVQTPKTEDRLPASKTKAFTFANVKIDRKTLPSSRNFVHNKIENTSTVTGYLTANQTPNQAPKGDYFIRAAINSPDQIGPVQIYTITKLPRTWQDLLPGTGLARPDVTRPGRDNNCETAKASDDSENLCISEHIVMSFKTLEDFKKHVVASVHSGRINELGNYRFSLLSPGAFFDRKYHKAVYDISGDYIMTFMSEIQKYLPDVKPTEIENELLTFRNTKINTEQMRSVEGFVHNNLENISTVTGYLMPNHVPDQMRTSAQPATGDYFMRAAILPPGKLESVQIYTITKLPFKWHSGNLYVFGFGEHVWLEADDDCQPIEVSSDSQNLCVSEHLAITFDADELDHFISRLENATNAHEYRRFLISTPGVGKVAEKYRNVEYFIDKSYITEFVSAIQRHTLPAKAVADADRQAQL